MGVWPAANFFPSPSNKRSANLAFLAVLLDQSRLGILSHDRTTWDAQINREQTAHPLQPVPENAQLNFQNLHDLAPDRQLTSPQSARDVAVLVAALIDLCHPSMK
jgi:hypothetical protein